MHKNVSQRTNIWGYHLTKGKKKDSPKYSVETNDIRTGNIVVTSGAEEDVE